MKLTIAFFVAVAVAAPAVAQTRRPAPAPRPIVPSISLRPFVMVTGQNFTAKETFTAVFGRSVEPFVGGGLQLAFRNGLYVEVTASRFKKTGERAFLSEDDRPFRLGIPLTATITPFEATGGFRFRPGFGIVPYVGGGIGSYDFKEESEFSEAAENLSVRHLGYLVAGGAEFRVHRWVGMSLDVQYTRIPGILGSGGISQDVGETDLGGTAARLKVIVGR